MQARSSSGSRRSGSPTPTRCSRRSSSSATRPCGCSSSAPPRARPGSRSTRRTPRTWRASASASTACRSRSSSPPAVSARSIPATSPRASTTASACCRESSHASPTRQHTLRATLQWSHDLLRPDERLLFRRLAVFAGSFDLAAVEQVCAASGLDDGRVADVLARLVEKSLVTVDEPSAARAPVPPARHRSPLRAGAAAGRRPRRPGSPRVTPAGRSRCAEASARRPRSTVTRRTCAQRSTRCSRRDPADALRLAIALCPFWLRRIELGEARRRFARRSPLHPSATRSAGRRYLAAAAIEFRSGALARGPELARRPTTSPPRSAMPTREWRALQRLGEFGIASDAADVAVPWIERGARARPARGTRRLGGDRHLLPRRRPLDARRPRGADEHVGRSVEILRGLDPSRADPVARRTSPRSARARSATGRTCRSSSRTRCSRSPRSRAARRWLCAREPGRDRPRPRRPRPCPGAARRERRPFRGVGRRAGQRGRARPPRLPRRWPRATRRGARSQLEHALELRRRRAIGAASGSRSPASGWSRRSAAIMPRPSGISRRRAASSAAPATAGASRARSGGRRISRSRATTSTRPRPPWRRRWPSSRDRA